MSVSYKLLNVKRFNGTYFPKQCHFFTAVKIPVLSKNTNALVI